MVSFQEVTPLYNEKYVTNVHRAFVLGLGAQHGGIVKLSEGS